MPTQSKKKNPIGKTRAVKTEKVKKSKPKAELAKEVLAEEVPTKTVNGNGEKYFEAVGRRKSAIARVRVYTVKSTDNVNGEDKALITVNGGGYSDYFHNNKEMENTIESPLKKLKSINRFKATVKVTGGGVNSQAEAIRHGLSRALVLFDLNFAKKLKKSGYLTRDPREKERRKYGLKKARKAPQWAKR